MRVIQVVGAEGFSIVMPTFQAYWDDQAKMENHDLTDYETLRLKSKLMLKMTDESVAVFVAADLEKVHGVASVRIRDGLMKQGALAAQIDDFFVAPESVGTTEAAVKLYANCRRWAREAGVRYVEATTLSSNIRVQQVLESRGFKATSIKWSIDLEDDDGRIRSRKGRKPKQRSRPAVRDRGDRESRGHRREVPERPPVREPAPPG